MKLRVLSWNANRDNIFRNYVYESLLRNDYDVIFLQEVALENLDYIRSKFVDYFFMTSKETLHSFGKKRTYYLVTLVKNNLINELAYCESLPLESVMPALYRLLHRNIDIEYSKIIFRFQNKRITLVNCHLQYACSPSIREIQLRNIFDNIDTEYFILAGDLNTFSQFPLSLLVGSAFDYPLSDYRLNESNRILTNPNFHSGKKINTTIYHTGKLDWILLSKNMTYLNEYRLTRTGSDHYPLVIECEI